MSRLTFLGTAGSCTTRTNGTSPFPGPIALLPDPGIDSRQKVVADPGDNHPAAGNEREIIPPDPYFYARCLAR